MRPLFICEVHLSIRFRSPHRLKDGPPALSLRQFHRKLHRDWPRFKDRKICYENWVKATLPLDRVNCTDWFLRFIFFPQSQAKMVGRKVKRPRNGEKVSLATLVILNRVFIRFCVSQNKLSLLLMYLQLLSTHLMVQCTAHQWVS